MQRRSRIREEFRVRDPDLIEAPSREGRHGPGAAGGHPDSGGRPGAAAPRFLPAGPLSWGFGPADPQPRPGRPRPRSTRPSELSESDVSRPTSDSVESQRHAATPLGGGVGVGGCKQAAGGLGVPAVRRVVRRATPAALAGYRSITVCAGRKRPPPQYAGLEGWPPPTGGHRCNGSLRLEITWRLGRGRPGRGGGADAPKRPQTAPAIQRGA